MNDDSSTAPRVGESARVLLVEDDPGIAALEERVLTESGYDVRIAGTGGEGLGMLHREAIDFVVLDHRLPDMTSIDFLEAMGERSKEIPVIVVTGLGLPALEKKALVAGARRFIVKDMALTFPQRIVVAITELLPVR